MLLRRGFFLRLLSIALFALMAICVRMASREVPVGQVVTSRGLFSLVPLLAYAAWTGALMRGFRTRQPGIHLKRGLIGGTALYCGFVAYASLPLATATALNFLTPLFTVFLAALRLKERITLVVSAMLLLGLSGATLVIAPELTYVALEDSTVIGIICGLVGAVLSAWAYTIVKEMTATEPAAQIAIFFSAALILLALPSAALGWSVPTLNTTGLLIAAGLLGGAGHVAMTEAFARTSVSSLAVCDYSALLWAITADVVIEAKWPTSLTVIGAILIVTAAVAIPALGARRHRANR